jgi:hypothetical protein
MDCCKQNSRLKKNGKMITSKKDLYDPYPPQLPPLCCSSRRRKAY